MESRSEHSSSKFPESSVKFDCFRIDGGEEKRPELSAPIRLLLGVSGLVKDTSAGFIMDCDDQLAARDFLAPEEDPDARGWDD